MAFQIWSWIFIIQIMLVRPSYAHVGHYGGALRGLLVRSLSDSELTTKNTFAAIAITASVVLVVGVLGLIIIIRRSRNPVKVPEPESGLVDAKPAWWMVEGKNEKMDWWRLSHRVEPAAVPTVDGVQPGDVGRIARLKAAIQRQAAGKKQHSQPIIPMHRSNTPSPTGSLGLPMQTIIQPQYPDSLEHGYQAPKYPTPHAVPQIPSIYVGDKPLKRSPRSPPRAILTGGQRATLARVGARNGTPRSPAARRRDMLHRHSFRNPFLPLKVSDMPLKISAPVPLAFIDPTNPKLTYAPSLMRPRAAPTPPGGPRNSYRPPVPPKLRQLGLPAPLNLNNQQPLSAAGRRVALPASPRPTRALNSAF